MFSNRNTTVWETLALLVSLVCLAGSAIAAPTDQSQVAREILDSVNGPEKAFVYDVIITENTTWSGSMQVGSVLVTNGATLTVAAGASLDMANAAGDGMLAVSNGFINCQGLAGNPVNLFSSAAPNASGFTWIGVYVMDGAVPYTGAVLSHTVVTNAFFGIAASGALSFATAANTTFDNCTFAVYQFGNLLGGSVSNCTSNLGGFELNKMGAANCQVAGANTAFRTDGGSVTDCTAEDCAVGYSGRGSFTRNLATDCDMGFWAEGYGFPSISFLVDNHAENCNYGYWVTGLVTVRESTCAGSTAGGIFVEARQDMPVSLYKVRVTGTTAGPGLRVQTQGDFGRLVTVSESEFSNNQTNVLAEENPWYPVTVNPLLLGQGLGTGKNSILAGPLTTMDVNNSCSKILYAEYCYWGQEGFDVPTPIYRGKLDFHPYLIGDPGIDIDNPFNKAVNPVPVAATALGAYPNPFNPSTVISYELARAGSRVRLDIFDIRGRLVTNLLDQTVSASRGEVQWNGTNSSGGVVATGLYFYSLQVDGRREATGKLILAK